MAKFKITYYSGGNTWEEILEAPSRSSAQEIAEARNPGIKIIGMNPVFKGEYGIQSTSGSDYSKDNNSSSSSSNDRQKSSLFNTSSSGSSDALVEITWSLIKWFFIALYKISIYIFRFISNKENQDKAKRIIIKAK